MSDKKQTAVGWIEDNIQSDMTFMDVLGLIRQAKEMESKKQQKYDEMLAMLEAFALMSEVIGMGKSIMAEQLIKEAKEL
jgi:hypothetical protein